MAHGVKTGGRKKGTPNKITASLRDMILGALNDAGGQEYLARQAEANPSAFLTLVGKILPMQMAGEPEAPLKVEMSMQEKRAQALRAIDEAFREHEAPDPASTLLAAEHDCSTDGEIPDKIDPERHYSLDDNASGLPFTRAAHSAPRRHPRPGRRGGSFMTA